MDARAITKALGGAWQGRYGLCRCPVHGGWRPLKVSDSDRRGIDVHCFTGCEWKDVKDALRQQGLLGDGPLNVKVGPAPEPEVKPVDWSLWHRARPLPGTLGETYFAQHRKLPISKIDLEHAVRFNGVHRMVVALMTDAITNEPVGIHRTFLDVNGKKIERKMHGRQGVVRITPDEDVAYGLGIAEGIEDAIAVALDWGPAWAATSSGAIERFPVLSGIDHLRIFADNDAAGLKAANACKDRWIAAGRESAIVSL
jgi:putative DNA primase/helicase